jgi:hypothetical protein
MGKLVRLVISGYQKMGQMLLKIFLLTHFRSSESWDKCKKRLKIECKRFLKAVNFIEGE